MMKRITTERKLENDNFNVKIGTVNKKKPKAFYLEGGVYLKPLINEPTYKDIVKKLYKGIKQSVYRDVMAEESLSNDYIMDVEVAADRITPERRTLLTFQCFLKQKNEETPENIDALMNKSYINKILDTIATEISLSDFALYKTKR